MRCRRARIQVTRLRAWARRRPARRRWRRTCLMRRPGRRHQARQERRLHLQVCIKPCLVNVLRLIMLHVHPGMQSLLLFRAMVCRRPLLHGLHVSAALALGHAKLQKGKFLVDMFTAPRNLYIVCDVHLTAHSSAVAQASRRTYPQTRCLSSLARLPLRRPRGLSARPPSRCCSCMRSLA